jgi:long-chain acyl-CoA synthetase
MSPAALIEQPFGTYAELIRAHARARPQHTALIQDDRQVSFATLDAMMDRVAATLQREGIRPTESIAICAGTSLEYAAVFLGALRAGIAVAPLAPSSMPQTIADMAANAEARLFFVDAAVAAGLAPVRTQIAVPWIALDESATGTRFSNWLAPAGSQPQPVTITPDMAFNLIYSSGTTGTPKGIVQSHKMRWGHVNRGGGSGYGPKCGDLLSTPLYSNTTLVSFFPTMALGGCAVLMEKFDVAKAISTSQQAPQGHPHDAGAGAIPPHHGIRRDFGKFDLSSFVMKFCTSAPFSAALKADILARWPGGLIEYYGMTEGGGGVRADRARTPRQARHRRPPVARRRCPPDR